MALDTVTLTGTVFSPDGDALPNGKITFTLDQVVRFESVIVPSQVSANLDSNGEFMVDIWPNDLSPDFSRYSVTVDYFEDSARVRKIASFRLGRAYILDASGQTLVDVLQGSGFDPDENPPEGTCVLFLFDNGGVDELRVRFANGTIKTIVDDVS